MKVRFKPREEIFKLISFDIFQVKISGKRAIQTKLAQNGTSESDPNSTKDNEDGPPADNEDVKRLVFNISKPFKFISSSLISLCMKDKRPPKNYLIPSDYGPWAENSNRILDTYFKMTRFSVFMVHKIFYALISTSRLSMV